MLLFKATRPLPLRKQRICNNLQICNCVVSITKQKAALSGFLLFDALFYEFVVFLHDNFLHDNYFVL